MRPIALASGRGGRGTQHLAIDPGVLVGDDACGAVGDGGTDGFGRCRAEVAVEDVFEAPAQGFAGVGGEMGAGDVVADDVDVAAAGRDDGGNPHGEGLDEGDRAGFVGGREDEPVRAGEGSFDLGGGAGEAETGVHSVALDGGAEFLGILACAGICRRGAPDRGLDARTEIFGEAMEGVEEQVPFLPPDDVADADELEGAIGGRGTG